MAERAAAFGRLCVETSDADGDWYTPNAAAFGRLCVETLRIRIMLCSVRSQPPSGGCVLKPLPKGKGKMWI